MTRIKILLKKESGGGQSSTTTTQKLNLNMFWSNLSELNFQDLKKNFQTF